jgi:DNA-binding HxlR family transcriptional regulator
MTKLTKFTDEQVRGAKRDAAYAPAPDAVTDPELDALVNELIGRVADKWTMLILEVLAEGGELRFTRISERVEGISQKMLTQTLRQMERDGLLTRTIHPVVPPRVEYKLTKLGLTLGGAFCGVWVWAAENLKRVEHARRDFDERAKTPQGSTQVPPTGRSARVRGPRPTSRPRTGAGEIAKASR